MKTLQLRKPRIHWLLLGLAVLGAAFLLTTHPRYRVATLGAALPPQARTGRISIDPSAQLTVKTVPKPPCSPTKKAEVLARVGALRHDGSFEPASVVIDCSLTLSSSDVITKRLVFKGTRASGVTVEGNGATIDGGSGQPNFKPADARNMVEIVSELIGPDPATGWARPVNIALRNLKIIGSVGIFGMAGIETTTPGFVTLARNNAPRNIVFDNVIITGVRCNNRSPQCVPLYVGGAVSLFQLLNSKINGISDGPNIYLDDLSYSNTFRNNRIEANSPTREVMAIDGSSYNTIVNNFFSSLEHGGIYLYRNCGEDNSKRLGKPTHNAIINNYFYYDKYDADDYHAIFVASRNGKGTKTYTCPPNFFDNAQFNGVMQNQIRKLPVSDVMNRPPLTGVARYGMIRVGRPDINTLNYIEYNETVDAERPRKAGCYISDGYPYFILDRDFVNLFRGANGEPVCRGYRLTCNDGVLTRSSDSTCQASQVGQVDFDCPATADNKGCQKMVSVPPGKKIVGAKAACNLEFGTVSETELNGVLPNSVKVLRASDDVSKGSCTLGSTTIRSGQAAVSGIIGTNRGAFGVNSFGPNRVLIGCREEDANGGDCHIKVRLYYR